ncbi:YIP1 family protein [Halorhabdus rudnickae]|uniref:YIP1 family protein n=1 Tax=Halorhabdus rudnickae TaxID=1775544 RepID=UPI0010843E51|nr:YIP1 family protein [Halorhabdus rudnickae]
MTQWVEPAGSGRTRGPVGLARAWLSVLVAPRQFFRSAVAPGDQAPGLVFLTLVVGLEEASRYALVPGATPVLGGQPTATAAFVLLATVVLVAPVGLHLLAALQTVLLWPVTEERAGVSETVQVLAYATAPCVFAGVPVPAIRVICAIYASALLMIGISAVHEIDYPRGAITGAIPATLLYGVAFRGFEAAGMLL